MSANEKTNDESGEGPETVNDDNDERHTGRTPDGGQTVPLFLRDRSDGRKGDAQDEKDETGE
jgi:hypothetical protein